MITLDFETRSVADLPKWGATRYALDPTTRALCMAWSFDQDEFVDLWHRDHDWEARTPPPQELIERIEAGELVEAHNAYFEFVIWNEVLLREYPDDFKGVKLNLEQMRCSAAKASCFSLPRNLGDAVTALGLEQKKLADGRRLINKLSKPTSKRSGNYVVISPGDAPQKAFGKHLYAMYPPGQTFATQDAKRLALEIMCSYPHDSVKEPGQSMQVILNRGVERGHLAYRGDACYETLDVPSIYRSEIVIPEYNLTRSEVEFCEEEIEHRRNWEYCKQDVRSERGLSNALPEMTERELQYWQMDLRMNQRGILLDRKGAAEALHIAEEEAKRLNEELAGLTDGAVLKGSQRKALLGWTNGRLSQLGGDALKDTRADTLSFSLYGVPTKAGDEAKANAKAASDEKWSEIGDEEESAEVRRVLEICMEVNKTSVAKYKRMEQSVCGEEIGGDGRLHDIMLYNGADRTGRWSGKGVQPHNFVRGYSSEMSEVWDDLMTLDLENVSLIWGEPMIALAKACRGALIASPGKTIYAADFNAIEARKLAWLSGCTKLLTVFQNKEDPYLKMAEAIYKRPLTKADKTERNLGKKAILGLGYAMGWEKFQFTVWNDEGIWLEDEFCQAIVNIYRKTMYPEIPKLWKDAGNAAINAVTLGGEHYCGGDEFGVGAVSYFLSDDGNFLHCRLPSGRLLAYLYPEVHTRVTYRFAALNERGRPTTVNFPAKRNVPQHKVRYHAERLAEKQHKRLLSDQPESFLSPHLSFMGRDLYTKKWKRVGTHGGSLVENFDQASSRDLLAEAMYRIDELPEFDLLLSIHDEVIAEAAHGTCTLGEFEALMAVVPHWAPGMPITAEGWIGERLRK